MFMVRYNFFLLTSFGSDGYMNIHMQLCLRRGEYESTWFFRIGYTVVNFGQLCKSIKLH